MSKKPYVVRIPFFAIIFGALPAIALIGSPSLASSPTFPDSWNQPNQRVNLILKGTGDRGKIDDIFANYETLSIFHPADINAFQIHLEQRFQSLQERAVLPDLKSEKLFPPASSLKCSRDRVGDDARQEPLGSRASAPGPIENRPNPKSEQNDAYRNQEASNWTRLKRAEALSLTSQLAGMAFLQAIDAWDTQHRPFSNYKNNLKEAWTSPPQWEDDSYWYNYIGHPYTGAFTYNLMRSQAASPLASWLFSCSQSLIWEYTLEATEQHPSAQDLLITSNLGSLLGEGVHRLTKKMRQGGFSRFQKFLVLLVNPAHVLNNGFH